MVHLAEGRVRELQHTDYPAVLMLPVRRNQYVGQHGDGNRRFLPMVGPYALPTLVHEVQVCGIPSLHRKTDAY